MKKTDLLIVFILSLFALQLSAQTYYNEWIDHSETYYKIRAGANGRLHKVPYSTLADAGIPLNGADFKMYYRGQEVPIYVSTAGEFGTNDYIEFYTENRNGEFDTQLYPESDWQPHTYHSLYSDTMAFFLAVDPSIEHLRFENMPNDLADAPTAEEYFTHTSRRVYKNVHHSGEPYRFLGGVNNYYADYGKGEGFASSTLNTGATFDQFVSTPSIYTPAGGDVHVKVRVLGNSDDNSNIPDHHLLISMDGTQYIEDEYEGHDMIDYEFDAPLAKLSEPNSYVTFTSVGDISDSDRHALSYIEITYPHSYDFANLRFKKFVLPNDGDKYLEITNFAGGSAPRLYDISNDLRIEPVIDNAGGQTIYKFHLRQVPDGESERTLFFTNTTTPILAVQNVEEITPVSFIDYSLPENQGDYLIVTHSRLTEGTTNWVEEYKNYRESNDGGAYDVVVLDVETLYDQFAYGIRKHPLAIKHLIDYGFDHWSVAPDLMLLLGKAVGYAASSNNINAYDDNLVPTYGHRESDHMLSAANPYTYRNRLGTGRLPVQTGDEVRAYLQKLMLYDANKYLPCTREDRLWMKHAVHIAGGNNLSEANEFVAHLDEYKTIYEDSLYGGKVLFTHAKEEEGIDPTLDLEEHMNNGLNVISFVGHSSAEDWDVDVCLPECYENYGKYPLMLSSSCFVGNIHRNLNENPAMAEVFVLADSLGAIGFLSPVSFGFPAFMHKYMLEAYHNMCLRSYNTPIGNVLREANADAYDLFPTSGGIKLTSQQYAYCGDPGVVINSWDRPEFIIDHQQIGETVTYSDVSFTPAEITAGADFFDINVLVTNLGMTTSDSITLHVLRTMPDGSTMEVSGRFPAPIFEDTLSFAIPIGDPSVIAGDNYFTVTVDADNDIEEDCEDNNTVTVEKFVFTDLLTPIGPCNYSIVSDPQLTLFASTGQPIQPSLPYKIQYDTTELFNSPMLRELIVESEAGVIQWQPDEAWMDNTVYYWRASQIPNDAVSYNWQGTSFIYMTDADAGWNQSHYYQFKHDRFEGLELDSASRLFDYNGYTNSVEAYNRRNLFGDIQFFLNDTKLGENTWLKGDCAGGLTIMALKPSPVLDPITAQKDPDSGSVCNGRTQYGSIVGNTQVKYALEFHTGTTEQLDNMMNFLNNVVPAGYYILVYSVVEHRLNTSDAGEPINAYMSELANFFTNMGVPELAGINEDETFIAFGRKGIASYNGQFVSTTDPGEQIHLEVEVEGKVNEGNMTPPPIGPANSWDRIDWQYYAFEAPADNRDSVNLAVWGIENDGTETLLLNTGEYVTDISSIDANVHPFLRIIVQTADTSGFTAPQIDYLRVYFERAAEFALDKQAHFNFYADTVQEGEFISLELGVTNAGDVDTDSLMVQYSFVSEDNTVKVLDYPHQPPVPAGETVITNFSYSTEGLGGLNFLQVELNPNDDQTEKFGFNNRLQLPFFVSRDKINPYMDVTFDGRHILDGDIVSAKPTIVIRLQDENPYLALNDTLDFEMFFVYPDGSQKPVYFGGSNVTFTPASASEASGGNNVARVELKPDFAQDGVYELGVKARDRSDNDFAAKNYRISFEVINEALVSNVLNYPNPFTTSTRFLFTLTGSETPETFKIQIMTVSGKVVREIDGSELGAIHIGRNLSEFAWDGTDEYGNNLANGLYLYRVVTRLNGQEVGLYRNGKVDSNFKNGIGKMYLMR